MRSRLVPVLLLAAVLAFACGPRSHSAETTARTHVGGGPPVASSFDLQLDDRVRFAFHITNNANKRLELTFPSGQTHDIVVIDGGGREVWRWSEGRMFTQALQSRVNALSNDFVGRDDPYQRAKIGEDRQKALAELDRVKADLEGAKKQISDIEEEARTAGVPPGWIR